MTDLPVYRREFFKTAVAGAILVGAGIQSVAGADGTDEDPIVYVGSSENTLYAINTKTGNEVWSFTEPSKSIYLSSPTIINGVVYVGSSDSTLYAVDAKTGDEVWSFTNPSGAISSSPTIVDGVAYVGSSDSTLYAVDAETGDEVWSFTKPSGQIVSSPNVVDGVAYVGSSDSTLYAVDTASGTEDWSFTKPSSEINSSPVVSDGAVFVGTNDGNLYAVDTATENERWSFTKPSEAIRSSPTVGNETIYFGSNEGILYAVNTTTGDEIWSFTKPSGVIRSSPTIVDGTLYVGSGQGSGGFNQDGSLWAIDSETGDQSWVFDAPRERVQSSPTVFDDTVYVGAQNNSLYAIDTETGNQRWQFYIGGSISNGVHSSPTVVTDPVNGDSVGSRVNSGTLGHHHVFAENGPTGPGIPDGSDLAASFTFDPKSPNIGETVTFDASGSSPADAIQEYRWDFTADGDIDDTGVTVGKIFEDAEEQTTRLTVVDDSGNETSTEKSLTVESLPEISISLTPQEIDFGVQSIASTPKRTLTLENTTGQSFTVDADAPASVRFSPGDDLFDIDLPFIGVEPPFSLDPGESQTATLALDTSEAVQNSSTDGGDAHLEQSISLSTESGEITEVPIRVTIFNGEAVESLRNAAKANSDLFDAEQIQEEGAYENLSNMYKNLFEIVKELGTGPNYLKAIKPLVDFANSVPQAAENNNIGDGIRKAKFDETPFEFSPEDFEDGYDEVSKNFDNVINEFENGNNSEVSNNYDDAEKRLKNLTDKWEESKDEFINVVGDALVGEDAFEKAEDLAIEYTNAVDGLFKLVQGTTPLYLTTASPVNITAIDPDGQKIGPSENEISGSIYKEIDRGKDGTTEDLIYIQDKKPGEYRVNVSKSDDGSGDSFSLVAVTDDDSMVLADETPTSDIPDDGYKIETSEAPESDPTAARPEDYATEDGLVTVNGLREAIADWRTSQISGALLADVTAAWRSRDSVN